MFICILVDAVPLAPTITFTIPVNVPLQSCRSVLHVVSGRNIAIVLQPGDKVVKCSASFGEEIWEAKNYGQVTYAIKTRNGDIYLELESRYVSPSSHSCFERCCHTVAMGPSVHVTSRAAGREPAIDTSDAKLRWGIWA